MISFPGSNQLMLLRFDSFSEATPGVHHLHEKTFHSAFPRNFHLLESGAFSAFALELEEDVEEIRTQKTP